MKPGSGAPRRTIRLKEHPPNLNTYKEVTDRIRRLSDDSLAPGPYLLRTDDEGFISTGNEVVSGSPDLFMIGGSFVESLCASEELRFASQVERGLSAAGTPYRVRNAGYSGMTTLHLLGVLTTKMPPLMRERSRLLLFVGQSDVNALSSPGQYWAQSKTVTPFGLPSAEADAMPQSWQEAFVRMVTTVVTFAKLHDFDLAITAGLFRHGDFAGDEVLRRTYRSHLHAYEAAVEKNLFVINAVRSIAEQHAVPLFDASAELLARPDFFYDNLHLNHDGQDAYSKSLTSWILNEWGAMPSVDVRASEPAPEPESRPRTLTFRQRLSSRLRGA